MKILSCALIFCLCLLSGCAYEWRHSTKSREALPADREMCEIKALQMYPQVIVPQQVGGGYMTSEVASCGNGESGKSVCVTKPGTYIPPRFVSADINKSNREAAIDQCLEAQGWRLIKKE